ncbi:glycosyltransferase family 2 protein [Pseudonocardia sp. TRM90224]|uniref:glycosyltransferase family 2 protein n=1 Tax=Pseudonocardia sp. TRM90224 TaxID=2812678 RepID=UPI001E53D49D|nr:glycosyltransferase family 2 protein [Pseudonocardia sp. TRM90224]
MPLPSVDVAIPCYRYGEMLPTAVQSVLSQDGVDVRVLIIDDASGDGSADVARELAASDPRIEVTEHETNRGHIATFTEGVIDWAKADYTLLMSADDALTPGALRRATAVMEADPRVALVYGAAIDWFGEMPLPEARTGAGGTVVHSGHDWIKALFARGANPVSSPAAVTRTSVQKVVGGYDPQLLHTSDLDMWMRVALHGDVGFVAGADQAYCRGHAANMSVAYEDSDGGVRDLRMRLGAFLALLEKSALLESGNRLPDVAQLERTVRRQLATDALLRVARSYDKGTYSDAVAVQLVAFAAETVGDLGTLPQWWALRVRRAIGPNVMPKLRYFVLPAVTRRIRQVGRDRQLVQRGV